MQDNRLSGTHFVVGLTGGIGSGKSAAADLFAEFGATVIDTDRIAHALSAAGGEAIPLLRKAFGDVVMAPDGSLDRVAMRHLAFADPDTRARLEAILHPMIRARCVAAVHAATGPYVVMVVPLLVESQRTDGYWVALCDRILVVDCPESMQIERVMARNGLSEVEVRAIMATQVSRAERCAAAHEIIDNAGDFDSLRAQVDSLHERYRRAGARYGDQP